MSIDAGKSKEKKYKGLAQTLRTVVNEEGFKSLWKGACPVCALF